jgi:pimeloyl-ACP methyl ester carboxylesterase
MIPGRPRLSAAAGVLARFSEFPLRWHEWGMLLTRCLSSDPRQWYMLYVPRTMSEHSSVLVAVHGFSRNAVEQATWFAPLAEAYGAVLVVPVFGADRYRDFQSITGGRNEARPDRALEAILAQVWMLTGLSPRPLRLFGYSGGAQFAHRYALAHPRRVSRLALASPERYTYPDLALRYPLGAGGLADRVGEIEDLPGFLRIRTRVWVGERDVEFTGVRKRTEAGIARDRMRRMGAAKQWVDAVKGAARSLAVIPDIDLHVVQGADRRFASCAAQGMVAHASVFLLG